MTKTSENKSPGRVPVAPNLFTMPDSPGEKPQLLASKCKTCGEITFPAQGICPRCSGVDLETIKLSRQGKIAKSTVLRHPPQLYKGTIPYVVAEVALPEGVPVPTIIRGVGTEEPPPYGLKVELDLEKFDVDEAGNDVFMYIFRPIRK